MSDSESTIDDDDIEVRIRRLAERGARDSMLSLEEREEKYRRRKQRALQRENQRRHEQFKQRQKRRDRERKLREANELDEERQWVHSPTWSLTAPIPGNIKMNDLHRALDDISVKQTKPKRRMPMPRITGPQLLSAQSKTDMEILEKSMGNMLVTPNDVIPNSYHFNVLVMRISDILFRLGIDVDVINACKQTVAEQYYERLVGISDNPLFIEMHINNPIENMILDIFNHLG
jgi:hypothetical protein